MTTKPRTISDIVFAIALLLAGLGTVWLIVRTAIAELLPVTDPRVVAWTGDAPDIVLGRAVREFITGRGQVSPSTMEAVGMAAQRAPLDARPYLLFATRDLVSGNNARALAALEAGRRLDGRQRWIRLLLLDRYLRTKRYDEAAREFAVLARLVSGAQSPIIAELARMTIDPATRGAVKQTLARDPGLERSLLATIARSNPDPKLLFSIASPAALAVANVPGEWGQVLLEAMVQQRRYAAARQVWRRIHEISASEAGRPLYDAGLRGLPGLPPFNWTLSSGSLGAVDRRMGEFVVTYYGRDTGRLASQLLVLAPGRYRLAYTLAGASMGGGPTLLWNLTCADRPEGPALLEESLRPTNARRRHSVQFSVAANCPAQWLALTGNAAEFPAEINVSISNLSIAPLDSAR